MATLHDFDSPSDELPPPTYEFSQQEFDQKISHALEQSRAVVDEEDAWEVWDEAAFAAAAAQLTVSESAVESASSSRSPPPGPAPNSPSSSTYNGDAQSNFSNEEGTTVQPLRIVKKSREPSVSQKERPNWYADAGLERPLPVPPRSPRNVPPNQQSVNHAHRLSDVPPTLVLEEREPTPPPIFEPIGPSLDGPPYEGYDEPPPQPERTGLVMAYVPGDSRPASPLHSPTSPSYNISQINIPPPPPLIQPHSHTSLPASPSPPPVSSSSVPRETSTQLRRTAIPSPRPPAQRQGLRPTASYRDSLKTKRYLPPRVAFDPLVAYGDKARSSYFNDTPEEPLPQDVDPASFYTASVSSIYSTNPKRIRTMSVVSSSLYSQSINSQSAFSLSQPPSQLLAHSQAGYSTHEGMRSPVPSVYSITSQSSSQHHSESQHTLQQVYQTHPTAASAHMSTHQHSMYQPSPHQHSQQLQQSTYQSTTYHQQPSSNSVYQASGYTPTAY